jgi:Tfp pilus assembly protein PilN
MIRINLLAAERPAAKKKAAAAPGALKLYLFLAVFGGGAALLCGALWWIKSSALKELDGKIAQATQRQQQLQVIKKQVDDFEAKKRLLDQKVALIEKLQAEKGSAVRMLDEISKNLPDFVWLTDMTQTGPTVKFSGQSNSMNSVADFIANLQKSGWFPKVELDTVTEANNVVTFTLTSTFQNPEAAEKERELAKVAPPPAPRK